MQTSGGLKPAENIKGGIDGAAEAAPLRFSGAKAQNLSSRLFGMTKVMP
jgi:hypothetical protein